MEFSVYLTQRDDDTEPKQAEATYIALDELDFLEGFEIAK
jgi:hypothetical protein